MVHRNLDDALCLCVRHRGRRAVCQVHQPVRQKKINPMIGACGISAFPMSSRVIHKMGLKEDPQNFLLMHAAGVNVGGQIASVIAGGLILNLIAR